MNIKPVIIIGIDPGYDRVGWAVGIAQSGKFFIQDADCIVTSKTDSLWQRYQQLNQELEALIKRFQPHEAALESLFFSKNQKTALHVSEARGVLISCFLRQQIQCFEYTPLQVKQAVTGFGKADKTAVTKMVRLQMGRSKLLSSPHTLDDTIDAVAVAMTHAASRSMIRNI